MKGGEKVAQVLLIQPCIALEGQYMNARVMLWLHGRVVPTDKDAYDVYDQVSVF